MENKEIIKINDDWEAKWAYNQAIFYAKNAANQDSKHILGKSYGRSYEHEEDLVEFDGIRAKLTLHTPIDEQGFRKINGHSLEIEIFGDKDEIEKVIKKFYLATGVMLDKYRI